jgi:hypothetical protein
LVACDSPPAEEYVTVSLTGAVKMAAGPVPDGPIYFRLYNLESGEGELAHPLEEIIDLQSETPEFDFTFEYPLHKGEGLAVHAWIDTDGDGIFCTPTSRTDPSGLATMEETPTGEVNLDVILTANCRAASWFYPPKP